MELIEKLNLLMKRNNIKNIAQLSKETKLPYTTLKSIFDGDVNDIRLSTSRKLCNYFHITLDDLLDDDISLTDLYKFSLAEEPSLYNYDTKQAFPLLGIVKAGYNYLAQENIVGYVNIDKQVSDPENYFALKVTGDSMQPIIYEDDIVIVHRQNDIESGQTGIILIYNEEATVKKVIKHNDYVELVAFNSYYPPKTLTKKDKFSIIGKVTEARISKIFE